MTGIFRSLTKLAAFGLIVGLAFGWAQSLAPFFDSFSHFRLHICAFLAIVMLRLLWKRRWKWLAASTASIAISLWLTSPYLPHQNLPERSQQANTLKVVQFNTLYNNRSTKIALQSLLSVDADIYMLQEINGWNFDILRGLLPTHPYYIECTRPGKAGNGGLVSRIPFDQANPPTCKLGDAFSRARIVFDGKTVDLATIHLRWPWPGRQHRQITRLRNELSKLTGERLILAGDFNAAPWSDIVERTATYTDTQVVEGVKLTWEPRFPRFHIPIGLTLPIDQIMSRGAKPVSRRVLPFAGSDHRPVLTHFVLE